MFKPNRLLFTYSFLFFLGLIFILLRLFSIDSQIIEIIFLFYLFILPGFLLSRLLKFKFESDFISLTLVNFTSGLIYLLSLSLVAIIFKTSINGLMWLYIIFTVVLFIFSLIMDFYRQSFNEERFFSLRNIFNQSNLVDYFLIFFGLLVFFIISQKGANFDGDPFYHLGIMRKALDGDTLRVDNLSYIKNHILLPYAYPLWQVTLAFFSKISSKSLFNIWNDVTLLLVPLTFFSWYYFLRKILPSRGLTKIAFLFFLIFIFSPSGYLFTRLPVPDTLSQLILLPFSLGISLNYIYSQDTNLKKLFFIAVLATFMAIVHFPHFIYFLLAIIIFGIANFILNLKNPDLKKESFKILKIIFFSIIIFLPYLILAEFTTQSATQAFNTYFYNNQDYFLSFASYPLYEKIGYLLLPIFVLLAFKNKKMYLPISLLVVIPLFYIKNLDFLGDLIARLFSIVTFKRIYNNLTFIFLIWSGIIYWLMMIWERHSRKVYSLIFSVFLILVLILLGLKTSFLKTVNKGFLSPEIGNQIVPYFPLIFGLFLVLSIVIYFYFIRGRNEKIFASEIENNFLFFFGVILISIFLSFPIYSQAATSLKQGVIKKIFIERSEDLSNKTAKINDLGGQGTIDFIKNKLPSRSTFYTYTGYYELPTLVNEYVPGYYKDANAAYYKIFQDDNILSIDDKLKCISLGKIDYIIRTETEDLLADPSFENYPEIFEPVYQGRSTIYKINQSQTDLSGDISPDFINNCKP